MVKTSSNEGGCAVGTDSLTRGLKKTEFDRIFREGIRVPMACGRLLVVLGSGRTGFTSNRNIGCNARRNRVKRRLKAAWREVELQDAAKLDLVFVGTREALQIPLPELVEQLEKACQMAQSRISDVAVKDPEA